jgi:arginine decarboxylase
MGTIYVASGAATGPTELSAYDAALAEANLHNYNLVAVSSIVPADATVERVDAAPDLGPAGNRLTVVQSHAATASGGRICAGLGWATGPGPGLFYEASGTDPDAVADELRRGLDAGGDLRDWELDDRQLVVEAVDADPDAVTSVVVLAAYGESEPIL